jgi:hypothetical protein
MATISALAIIICINVFTDQRSNPFARLLVLCGAIAIIVVFMRFICKMIKKEISDGTRKDITKIKIL